MLGRLERKKNCALTDTHAVQTNLDPHTHTYRSTHTHTHTHTHKPTHPYRPRHPHKHMRVRRLTALWFPSPCLAWLVPRHYSPVSHCGRCGQSTIGKVLGCLRTAVDFPPSPFQPVWCDVCARHVSVRCLKFQFGKNDSNMSLINSVLYNYFKTISSAHFSLSLSHTL